MVPDGPDGESLLEQSLVPILDASIHIVPVLIGGTMKQLMPPDTSKF